MKKRNNIQMMLFLLITTMIFTSCNTWLDVKPKTEEEADELFSTLYGFKSALSGAYIGLSQPELYGREMTFGMLGILGQEWGNGDKLSNYSTYSYLKEYKFENTSAKAMTDEVWNKMYNSIANINNIIEYADLRKTSVLKDNYSIIKGEAIAMRAYAHFDLFRLFVSNDFTNDDLLTIPYVTEAKPQIYPQLKLNDFYTTLLKDIDDALEFLKNDPIFTGEGVTDNDDGYYNNRVFHMNYYAVLALKARVCLYKKDYTDALSASREVINAIDKGVFSWVNLDDLTTMYKNLRDRTFSSEQIFSFNTMKLEDYIKGYFREATIPLMSTLLPNEFYEGGDYRKLLYETYSGQANVFTKFWQMEKEYVAGEGMVSPKKNRIPALKIAEMYFIASEASLQTDINAAQNYLNEVRIHRGLNALSGLTTETLQIELQKEYYREFIGEGQLYYYYKRLGIPTIYGKTASYKIDMPENEIDLGNRK